MNELSEHFNYLRLKRVTSLCLLEQLCKNDSSDFHKVLTQGRNDYIFLVLRLCYVSIMTVFGQHNTPQDQVTPCNISILVYISAPSNGMFWYQQP